MAQEFDVTLQRLEGKIKWIVLYVPFSVNGTYGTSGRLQVKATIDGHCFSGTLLPSKKGHYMVCNQQIRETCRKGIGDTVHVVIEPDSEPRSVQIPKYLLEKLNQQPDILTMFQAQPEYLKREQINHIETAKGDETRERRIRKLLDSMRNREKS